MFIELSDRIATVATVSLVQCHNYAIYYSRAKWLADVLTMSSMFLHRFRKRQQEIARKPRGHDDLQQLIVEIVSKYPKNTCDDVLQALKNRQHTGILETVNDDVIEWTNNKGEIVTTNVTGLKDRVSKAKKFLNSL